LRITYDTITLKRISNCYTQSKKALEAIKQRDYQTAATLIQLSSYHSDSELANHLEEIMRLRKGIENYALYGFRFNTISKGKERIELWGEYINREEESYPLYIYFPLHEKQSLPYILF
jgi:hypothetical protein